MPVHDTVRLGAEQADVAFAVNGLANFYAGLGRYAEAEPLYQEALITN